MADDAPGGTADEDEVLVALSFPDAFRASEFLTAAQALDFRSPLKPGKGIRLAHELLRSQIGHAHQDYEVRNDLDLCADILRRGDLASHVEAGIGNLA